jgi:hypothetical protein
VLKRDNESLFTSTAKQALVAWFSATARNFNEVFRQFMKTSLPPRTLSVAPMMDWTDRHCRVFHRQITRHTWLYTEMVTTGALLHGDVPRHLDFDEQEHPVALQLGGSEPADLAQAPSWASNGAMTRST